MYIEIKILKYVDILVSNETKLDDSFPASQFSVDGFSTDLCLGQHYKEKFYFLMISKIFF